MANKTTKIISKNVVSISKKDKRIFNLLHWGWFIEQAMLQIISRDLKWYATSCDVKEMKHVFHVRVYGKIMGW